jgi:hypothetical protein
MVLQFRVLAPISEATILLRAPGFFIYKRQFISLEKIFWLSAFELRH